MLTKNQNNGLQKLASNKVGALFMDMGAGKTRVAIEWLKLLDADFVLWVGPLRTINPLTEGITSIKDEVEKWGGINVPHQFVGVESIGQSDRIYLDTLSLIQKYKKVAVVVDESIKIKNSEAKRTERVWEIGKLAKYKMILNGEPIVRDLLDIWSQFQFLDPEIINMPLAQFKNTFVKYKRIEYYTSGFKSKKVGEKEIITGYENIDYLYSLIGEYLFECTLELEVKQLFETIQYDLSAEEKNEYTRLKEKYLDNEVLMLKNNNIFIEMTQKMQHSYCCTPEKFEKLDLWLESKDQSKLVIYCKYVASAAECKRRYPSAIILNYKSGSLGFNLQDRNLTVYFDGTFDWGDVAQSERRTYRTGQKENCYYLTLIAETGLHYLISCNNLKKGKTSKYFKEKSNAKSL